MKTPFKLSLMLSLCSLTALLVSHPAQSAQFTDAGYLIALLSNEQVLRALGSATINSVENIGGPGYYHYRLRYTKEARGSLNRCELYAKGYTVCTPCVRPGPCPCAEVVELDESSVKCEN